MIRAMPRILREHLSNILEQSVWDLEEQKCYFLQESYRAVMRMKARDFTKRLLVKFRGEDGLDYGGIARLVSPLQTRLYMLHL